MDLKKAYFIFCSYLFFTFKALALSYADPMYWDLRANSLEADAQAKLSDRETIFACEYMLLPESKQEEELSSAISNCLSKLEAWQDLSLEELRRKYQQTLVDHKKMQAKPQDASEHHSREVGYGNGDGLKWLGQVPEYESRSSAKVPKTSMEKETFLGQAPLLDEESALAGDDQEEFEFDRRADYFLLSIIEADESKPQRSSTYSQAISAEDTNSSSINGFDGDDRLW